MTNIFQLRDAARRETEVVPAIQAINTIANRLDMIKPSVEELEFGVFEDRDRHHHLVVLSKKYNEEQLDRVYDCTYLTGNICGNRSAKYWNTQEARMKVIVDGKECQVDSITVASLMQMKYFGLNDMKLISYVLAWLNNEF